MVLSGTFPAGNEDIAIRESKRFCRLAEIRGEHILGTCRVPLRQIDGLVAHAGADIDRVVTVLPAIVDKLRSLTRAPARV